jgi:pentapeptide MXKDX repeat protein
MTISNEINYIYIVLNNFMLNGITPNDIKSYSKTGNDIMSNDIMSNDIISNDIISNDIMSNDIMSNDIMSNEMIFGAGLTLSN